MGLKNWIKSRAFSFCYFVQYYQIVGKIFSPRIKVVSFDIFDTLLIRPVIYDRDLLFLISEKAKTQFDVDFLKLRYDAESEMRKPYSNIYDIWDYIAKTNNLSDEQKDELLNLEIKTEEQLLRPRKIVFELYKYAVRKKKRVIAVSDMYLPSAVLKRILEKNGYDEISEIYVSCEQKNSKVMKNLQEKVLQKEGVKGNEIIHIGDNYYADFKFTREKMKAAYFPSNVKLFCRTNNIRITDYDLSNPFLRIMLGFALASLGDAFCCA